jgi:hypothetical protein
LAADKVGDLTLIDPTLGDLHIYNDFPLLASNLSAANQSSSFNLTNPSQGN